MNGHPEAALQQVDSPLQRALREELEQTRRAFHTLLAALDPEDWDRYSSNPAWTIGELLWHITSFLFIIPQQLRLLQMHAFPDLVGESADELNADNVERTRADAQEQTFGAIAQTYDEGHALALAALATVRDDEWPLGVRLPDMGPTFSGEYRTIEGLFRYHARHFAEHAAQITSK